MHQCLLLGRMLMAMARQWLATGLAKISSRLLRRGRLVRRSRRNRSSGNGKYQLQTLGFLKLLLPCLPDRFLSRCQMSRISLNPVRLPLMRIHHNKASKNRCSHRQCSSRQASTPETPSTPLAPPHRTCPSHRAELEGQALRHPAASSRLTETTSPRSTPARARLVSLHAGNHRQ
jgi:hypothetical protein